VNNKDTRKSNERWVSFSYKDSKKRDKIYTNGDDQKRKEM
jgi:hypothetical protein